MGLQSHIADIIQAVRIRLYRETLRDVRLLFVNVLIVGRFLVVSLPIVAYDYFHCIRSGRRLGLMYILIGDHEVLRFCPNNR